MSNPLFSTYSQGENRVTASILAVFERISFALVEEILQRVLEEPETELVTFHNQPSGPSSIPDARIHASFSYWIEAKIQPDSVERNQLERHLEALDEEHQPETQRLLVLTPDATEPTAVQAVDDDRVAWTNFESLNQAIRDLAEPGEEWLSSSSPLPTEREREMLRELIRFLTAEELIGGAASQVLVVAARKALPEYHRYSLYICQPNRTFQPTTHLAFYTDGAVHPEVPAIRDTVESVMLTSEGIQQRSDLSDEAQRELLELVRQLRSEESPRHGLEQKILFLSEPEDADTITLPHPIENDLTADSGRTVAFVQGHRYVSKERLQEAPEATSALLRE